MTACISKKSKSFFFSFFVQVAGLLFANSFRSTKHYIFFVVVGSISEPRAISHFPYHCNRHNVY